MTRKPTFSFNDTDEVGIDQVPLNALILIEDDSEPANGTGSPKLIYLNDKTSIDGATTISELLALTTQWNEVGGGSLSRSVYNFTATAAQTVFTITYDTATNTDVYLNGVKMIDAEQYTLSGNDTLTLENGAQAGDLIELIAFI